MRKSKYSSHSTSPHDQKTPFMTKPSIVTRCIIVRVCLWWNPQAEPICQALEKWCKCTWRALLRMERALAGLGLSPCVCQSAYPAQICSATCAVGVRAKQSCPRARDKRETGTDAIALAAWMLEAGLSATPTGVCLKLQQVLCKIDILMLRTREKRASVPQTECKKLLFAQHMDCCKPQAFIPG